MAKADLTAERLRELLHYDPETGVFTWINASKRNKKITPGVVAGWTDSGGYRAIMIDGQMYFAHRLAWFYIYDVWPEFDIDHKNGKRSENWIDNLRDVSTSTNCENRRAATKFSKSGFLGVSPQRGKWKAGLRVKGIYHYLGTFDDPETAHQTYLQAKRNLHEGCTV